MNSLNSLPTAYQYRPAQFQDQDAVKGVIWQVLEEYDLIPDNPELDYDLDDIPKFYQNGYFGLITNASDAIVGTFALYQISEEVAEIRKMYLLPEVRRQGIGKWMLQFLVEKAKELGYPKVQLLTASVLQEALALYEKSGFQEIPSPECGPRCDRAFEMIL